ncbi:MAG TPA: VWA domain-containing protein [Sphingomonadaceae bacterium]|nr:VWA domain-containing protein [Sphingomonadaceae bacterium]
MFFNLVEQLRDAGIPASAKEQLLLLEALDNEVIERNLEQFYFLSRSIFVKDEALLDRFDLVFQKVFRGIVPDDDESNAPLPEDWLKAVAERFLSEEEMARIKSLGSWEEIMAALKERLAEQQERHEGGNRWIGTGGTSPFGNAGYNPEGVRIGGKSTYGRAIKVWEQRQYRDLDSSRELGTRNIKLALRRLRKFARESAAHELDLEATIEGTARQGWLDIRLRPERHNAVKLLLFLDVGGSMDPHIRICEELFSAATSEFKHLEFFYFHNCLYESVWKDNLRKRTKATATWDVLHKFGSDYKVIFVGDAAMSPYEILQPGGAIEHFNEEPGARWLERVASAYPAVAWLNPVPERYWDHSSSTGIIRQLIGERMYPLTLDGIDQAMRSLSRKRGH